MFPTRGRELAEASMKRGRGP